MKPACHSSNGYRNPSECYDCGYCQESPQRDCKKYFSVVINDIDVVVEAEVVYTEPEPEIGLNGGWAVSQVWYYDTNITVFAEKIELFEQIIEILENE